MSFNVCENIEERDDRYKNTEIFNITSECKLLIEDTKLLFENENYYRISFKFCLIDKSTNKKLCPCFS